MFGSKKKVKTSLHHHLYKDIRIPLRIYTERRSNVRISFGQQNVLLRLPLGLNQRGMEKHLAWAREWIDLQLDSNPKLVSRFITKEYKNGDQIQINGDQYVLQLVQEERKTISAKAVNKQVILKLPVNHNHADIKIKIRQALSRLFASIYRKEIEHRIDQLNDLHFKEEIQSIRIKYNKSNWGSCSAKRNLNISSRLLFAPKDIQDYVFIHELTHLKELNHSKRFWTIVGKIVPDYKAKEKWLKENSHWMDF